MKVGELKEILKNIDDEFEIKIDIVNEIPPKELEKSTYPYPYSSTDGILELHDIAYSEKVICFGIYEKEDL